MGKPGTRLAVQALEDRVTPATFVVSNTNDAGLGSLRQALADLGGSADPANDITFTPTLTGAITLASNLPTISKSVTVQGLGARLLLDANNNAPFTINDVAMAGITVTLNDLSVRDGKRTGDGGTLSNANANVVLRRVMISSSEATNSGSAVAHAGGSLTIEDSLLTGNSAGNDGTLLVQGGIVSVNRTLFVSNDVADDGGVVFQTGGTLTIRNSAMQGNSSGFWGGGMRILGGSALVENSSITDNKAAISAGGVRVSGATTLVTVRNVTISGNESRGNGGGVEVASGTLNVLNSTVAFNKAESDGAGAGKGGGVFVNAGALLTLTSTIVAKNTLGATGTNPDVSGTVVAASAKNLVGVVTGLVGISNGDANGNQVGNAAGLDPRLLPLESSGITRVHPLQASSPAVDAGSNPAALATDGRGGPFVRTQGGGTDIGAFEAQPDVALVVTTVADENDPGFDPADLSLREALRYAGAGAPAITFAPALAGQSINLTLGALLVTGAVSITGPGANLLTIDGGGRDTVMIVADFVDSVITPVTVSGLTIRGGASGAGGLFPFGGGVLNTEALVLTGVAVRDNRSSLVGGGLASLGSLTIRNSTVSGNTADLSGGGIAMVEGNLVVSNSTVSGNSAKLDGGGVLIAGGTATLANSTVTLNRADADNVGGDKGGGVALTGGTGTLVSTIVAGNVVGTSGSAPDLSGTMKASFLIVGNPAGFTPGAGSDPGTIVTADPLLGPLADNGGPTLTHALLPGSPAIDAGSNPAALATDQRGTGFNRVVGPAADIGAFEFGNVPPVVVPPVVVPPVVVPPVVVMPLPLPPAPVPTTASVTREFAVGADVGSGAARLLNQDRSVRLALTPFGDFAGGVRTASADFNGDGVADLVVGTGPGRSTEVVVFDGVTGAELFRIRPFEPAFTGGVYVTAGDVTGDGVPELIITPDEGGGPRVRIFNGVGFGQLADFFGIDDPAFRGGARASVADLTGDGKGEVVVAAGFGGGPRITVWNGAVVLSSGGVPSPAAGTLANFFAFETALRNGAFVTAADFTGDGRADLAFGGGPGGGPRVRVYDGTVVSAGRPFGSLDEVEDRQLANFFAGDDANRGGVRLGVMDGDNDGRADLLAGAGTGAGSRVTAYSGGNPAAELFALDAFPGFQGGVFVG